MVRLPRELWIMILDIKTKSLRHEHYEKARSKLEKLFKPINTWNIRVVFIDRVFYEARPFNRVVVRYSVKDGTTIRVSYEYWHDDHYTTIILPDEPGDQATFIWTGYE